MDRTERKKIIVELIQHRIDFNYLFDDLNNILGIDIEGRLAGKMFSLFKFTLEQTALAIGDKQDWLEWFVYENDCGAKKMEAGYDDNLKPICTVDDLIDLIKEAEK